MDTIKIFPFIVQLTAFIRRKKLCFNDPYLKKTKIFCLKIWWLIFYFLNLDFKLKKSWLIMMVRARARV